MTTTPPIILQMLNWKQTNLRKGPLGKASSLISTMPCTWIDKIKLYRLGIERSVVS